MLQVPAVYRLLESNLIIVLSQTNHEIELRDRNHGDREKNVEEQSHAADLREKVQKVVDCALVNYSLWRKHQVHPKDLVRRCVRVHVTTYNVFHLHVLAIGASRPNDKP